MMKLIPAQLLVKLASFRADVRAGILTMGDDAQIAAMVGLEARQIGSSGP